MSPRRIFSLITRRPSYLASYYVCEMAGLGALVAVLAPRWRTELELTPVHVLAVVAAVPFGWWISSVLHAAAHEALVAKAWPFGGWWNRFAGEVSGAYVGYGFASFVLIHGLHHAHADTEQDPVSPRGRSFLAFLSAPMRFATPRARVYLDRAHGRPRRVLGIRGLEWAIFHANLLLRVAVWYLLFGPELFVVFYVPSILSNIAILAHINFACHRDGLGGVVRVVNLDHNWYYRIANWVTSGGYFHRAHHLHPGARDPRAAASLDQLQTTVPTEGDGYVGWGHALGRYFDVIGVWGTGSRPAVSDISGAVRLGGSSCPWHRAASSTRGPRGLSLVRLLVDFSRDSIGALERSHATYGDSVAFHWPVSTTIVYAPETVRELLIDHQAHYEKGAQTRELSALMGDGLVTNNHVASWRNRRSLVDRAMRATVERDLLPALRGPLERMLVGFERVPDGTSLDVATPLRKLTLDVACSTLLGGDVSEADAATIDSAVLDGSRAIHERMFSLFRAPRWVPTANNRRVARHRQRLDAVVLPKVHAARRALMAGGESPGVLGALLRGSAEPGAESLTPAEVRDEVVTLLIAGYETTANALAWTCGLLARHPCVQDRVFDESRRATEVAYADLRRTHRFTWCVIAESLRLYPTIAMSSRRAITDDVIGRTLVRRGTNVVVPIWNLHRDPLCWEDPGEFRPERFEASSDGGTRCPGITYAPFSKGERACIGRSFALVEMANTLLAIMSRFEIVAIADTMPVPVSEVSLRPRDGMSVQLRRRVR